MLPRETLATAEIPGGDTLTLVSHGRDHIIMLGRDELMGTRMQYSEEQLAELTLEQIDAPAPRVLIGGYGLGFTYRADAGVRSRTAGHGSSSPKSCPTSSPGRAARWRI